VLEEQSNYVWYGALHWDSYYTDKWDTLIWKLYRICDEEEECIPGGSSLVYCYTQITDAQDFGVDTCYNGDVYPNHERRILRPSNLPPRQHDLVVAPGCHVLALIPTEFVWDGKVDHGLRAFDWMDCIRAYIEDFPHYIGDPEEAFRQFVNASAGNKDVDRIMKNVAYPYPEGYYIIRVGFRTLDPKIADPMIMAWKDGKLPIERRARGKGTRKETPAGEEAGAPPEESGGQD